MKKLLAFCFMVCCAVAQAQLVTYPEGLKQVCLIMMIIQSVSVFRG